MLRNLGKALLITLAANFLLVAGGVGYLWQTGRLRKPQVAQIKEILFPPPPAPAAQLASAEDEKPTTQPVNRLEELLARASGRTAAEQVRFIQENFDSQMAQLDRRHRELLDLQRQVDLAQQQLVSDRAALASGEQNLRAREEEAQRLANDQGFQDSLSLYNTLSGKQVKTIFMGLDDQTVARYLQAMPPRTASKVIKEFKTPQEVQRIQRVLERIRQSQPPATQPAGASQASAGS
jgi:hypothetical protein